MWQRCTCSLPKSSRATSSEMRSAAERAPRGATLINLAHFLRDVRETKRGRHFITRKGSLWSAFSTSCLNTEGEMALIMFWGMFGFGEMVSSISFMGGGGGWLCWRACLLRAERTTDLKLHLLACFITQLNMEFHSAAFFWFFLCFLFGVNIIKTFQQNRTFRGLRILCLYVFPLKNSRSWVHCKPLDAINWSLLCCLFSKQSRPVVFVSRTHQAAVKVAARPPLIMWLCHGTKNSRRRSLCQEFCFSLPRGLQRCIFLLQQVPRLYQCYHFIATSYPATPTTRRHRWHWLRCAKNLLMCLNYLRLMLGAKRLQQCPGTALFLWWKFFEDHSFASYLLHCRERCRWAQRPLEIHWLILKLW